MPPIFGEAALNRPRPLENNRLRGRCPCETSGDPCVGRIILGAFAEAGAPIYVAYFGQDPKQGVLRVSHAYAAQAEALQLIEAHPSCRVGEERDLIGLVAQEGLPRYLMDTPNEPRWVGLPGIPCRTASLVPVSGIPDQPGHDVLVVGSHKPDAFAPELQALFEGLARQSVKLAQEQYALRARVKFLENALHKVALGLEEAGVPLGGRAEPIRPEALADLHNLSQREWSVLRRLLANQRTSAIAQALYISPHTVRNHLKSIFRKTGVSSQAELIEWLQGTKPEPPQK